MAVMSSGDTEDYIADAGASVLPVGGFSGDDGYPSLTAFKALVASGELTYVLLDSGGRGGAGGSASSGSTEEISSWVTSACKTVSSSAYSGSGAGGSGASSAGTSGSVGTLYACSAS
jgi:hypothetical protein